MLRLIFLLLFSPLVYGQAYNFDGRWQFLGPDDKPEVIGAQSAAGVGPVEFIRVYKNDPQHLLAGSLSGGLFFSTDGGESWANSGSDAWPYSGCGWADFHPEDQSTWFAYSHFDDKNGKPGKILERGGIYRTTNSGITWELIFTPADLSSFELAINGFRFNPLDPDQLFVMTEEAIFYTNHCLAADVVWNKMAEPAGLIYDMDFIESTAYISSFQSGKWSVGTLDLKTFSKYKQLASVSELELPKRSITFEPFADKLLVLIDYKDGGDELHEYDPANGDLKKLIDKQQVNFGSGHTFAMSPHKPGEFLLGYGTNLKKWNYETLKGANAGSGYHVDVEFVVYDPIDTAKIYMACHGGVYISYDSGKTWKSKTKGIGIAEVMGMDVSETDPNEIVIGTFHDGSSVRADFDKDGIYTWRAVNGGDALTPIIDPADPAIIYTSTQFTGGGLYYSNDTAATFTNIHSGNGLKTSGWELSAVLHPIKPKLLYFNFHHKEEEFKGNIDIARTPHAGTKKTAEVISDFRTTHGLEAYRVYGIYNNAFFPEHLYAYVLHYHKDTSGNPTTTHRVYRTNIASDSASKVIQSWYELATPVNDWIGDIEGDPSNPDVIYISYLARAEATPRGMIYALTYHKKRHRLKKVLDITQSLPNSVAGRFNMVCRSRNGSELFMATRTGVWYADANTLAGYGEWQQVGVGLPHCKIFGLHYHEGQNILTVGLFGRGIWRCQL